MNIPLIPWGRIGIAVGILACTFCSAGWLIEARRADKLEKQVQRYKVADGLAQQEIGRLKAEGVRIAAEEKARHEKDVARIDAGAADLRVRGPGAARCQGPVSRPSSGGEAAPEGSAPVAQVPDGEGQQLIGVPFDPAVALARNHDALRAEVLAWRQWWSRINDQWSKDNAK